MKQALFFGFLMVITAFLFSGCVRDVSLSEDVDMILGQTSNQSETFDPLSGNAVPSIMNQPNPNAAMPPVANQPNPNAPVMEEAPPPPQQIVEQPTPPPVQNERFVQIVTEKGAMVIELRPDVSPNTVAHFVEKVKQGFYNGLVFHRVEDWVIQGGGPAGTGTGGGTMPTEFSSQPFVVGSVGVARGADRNLSNDAQFFICTKDCSWLTGEYTWFGQVIEGMDVAGQVAIGEVMKSVSVVSR
jgi:cyclophilin family peptidyl-prolyl cis-trans isomerase